MNLSSKKSTSGLQASLAQFVGSEVTVKANHGRKRYVEHSGVLDGTYSKLFVVRVADQNVERKLSFSYVDLLTENVILLLHRDGKEYKLVVNKNQAPAK